MCLRRHISRKMLLILFSKRVSLNSWCTFVIWMTWLLKSIWQVGAQLDLVSVLAIANVLNTVMLCSASFIDRPVGHKASWKLFWETCFHIHHLKSPKLWKVQNSKHVWQMLQQAIFCCCMKTTTIWDSTISPRRGKSTSAVVGVVYGVCRKPDG